MKHFYIIYKITNKVNQKFYIGIHKTENINDDYCGSGLCIKAAIKKYGIDKFEKTILHIFIKRKDALMKEREIVNEKMIENPLCYNLTVGGYGGFHYIRKQNKHASCKGRKIIHNKSTKQTKKVILDDLKKYIENGWELGFLPESLEKMSQAGKKKIQSIEHRKKNSDIKKDSCLIENSQTKKRKYIKKIFLNDYLKNNEWVLFDKYEKLKGLKSIYNKTTNEIKRIKADLIEEYIKMGWETGFPPITRHRMTKNFKSQST